MKIIIISPAQTGGGNEKALAYAKFLQSLNHTVNLVQIPGKSFHSKLFYYYNRGTALLHGREKRHMKKTADFLEKIIRKNPCDVVISFESFLSYVLTRDLPCLKIYNCESLGADELYFSKRSVSSQRVQSFRDMELELLTKSDYVIFPWTTTENYVKKHVLNGANFVTIKHGCYPQSRTVSYKFPPSVVSLGSVGFYWSNRELLSYLTHVCPYIIDVYSKYKPPRKYKLNYKGFASSTDILYNYLFGLSTVTKDAFRRNHFSSRPLSYIAYGLPVLSPDWMQFSHELRGCLPYNEHNFVDIVEKYSDRCLWEKLSKDAHEQALELDWKKTLKPLEKIITC